MIMAAQNTKLPAPFRRVHLALAREPGHPDGAGEIGYDFVAPLDSEGRIIAKEWRAHRALCRAVRIRPNDQDIGHLVRRPGGSWAFRYDTLGDEEDEAGYRFGEERFRVGEYVSIAEDDVLHTYRVTSVTAP
jgi:hypothetical protein